MNYIKGSIKILLTIFFISIVISCDIDHGIVPKPPIKQTGFSGNITFIGAWPDSIQRTHIVIFKDPLLTLTDFNIFNLKYVSWEIPYGIRTYNFSSMDSSYVPANGTFEPGEYSYVAVAQQKTINLSLLRKDWFVVGVYYANGDTSKPGKLIIHEGEYVRNINIICDFNHPPPQPPGGN